LALVAGFAIVACSPAAEWTSWAKKARALVDRQVLMQKGQQVKLPTTRTIPALLGRPGIKIGKPAPPPMLGGIGAPPKGVGEKDLGEKKEG
jgi:hypothetical protein